MKKYPVISKKGNVYQVEVFFGESISKGGLNVVIRRKYKLFGIEFFRKLKEWAFSVSEEEAFKEYGGYVDIAKLFVAMYENDLRKATAQEIKEDQYRREFEEWDGIC